MAEPKVNRFAVIGNPVTHSLSPYIHQSFAGQFGVNLNYHKILAEQDTFQRVFQQFFDDGGRGLNITTPFKALAAECLTNCSDIAKACRSVNTILLNDSGELRGESTDGEGWLADVRRLKISLTEKKVLVIGAGGAARIIVDTLLSEDIQMLHICNRTEQRAEQLIELNHQKITASGLTNIPKDEWDLVINTLSIGWHGDYPSIIASMADDAIAYDLNYGPGAQSFRKWFVTSGGQQCFFNDGWGMLVKQAAGSFYHWWGCKPSTDELIRAGIPSSS